jgi:hypothetical protein
MPMGPETKNGCAVKASRNLPDPIDKLFSRRPSRTEAVENGRSRERLLIVRSRYQATISENIADWEDLKCALVICTVSRRVKML